MDIINHRPQSIWQIFSNSFGLFKKTWLPMWPLTISFEMVILLPFLCAPYSYLPYLLMGYFVVSIFVFSSAVYYTMHVNKGETIYLTQAILVTAKKFLVILITTILMILLTLIAYCFLIVPGIITTVWLSMCLPLILLEHVNPLNVLRKSYELTTDNWTQTAVVVFSPFFITTLTGVIVNGLGYKLGFLYYQWIMIFVISLFSIFYLPWMAALLVLQFEDLQNRKALRTLSSPSLGLESQKNEL